MLTQVRAVQELCKIITKQMNAIHTILTNDPASNGSDSVDIIMTQHVLVCALEELSNLIQAVTSSVKVPLFEHTYSHVPNCHVGIAFGILQLLTFF